MKLGLLAAVTAAAGPDAAPKPDGSIWKAESECDDPVHGRSFPRSTCRVRDLWPLPLDKAEGELCRKRRFALVWSDHTWGQVARKGQP